MSDQSAKSELQLRNVWCCSENSIIRLIHLVLYFGERYCAVCRYFFVTFVGSQNKNERDGDVGMSGFAGNSNDSTFSDV